MYEETIQDLFYCLRNNNRYLEIRFMLVRMWRNRVTRKKKDQK